MFEAPDRAASILSRFNSAHNAFVSMLRGVSPAAAEQPPAEGAWSAAQVGWHVALANEWSAAVLLGTNGLARPCPNGFHEDFDPASFPERVKTFPTLEPPAVLGRDSALERLRVTGQGLSKAIASLTPERGMSHCVSLPFGNLSLFEFAEFSTAHVGRHARQIRRILDQLSHLPAMDAAGTRPHARH